VQSPHSAQLTTDTVVDALRDFALNSPDNDIVEASLYALSRHTGERAIVVLSDIAISGKDDTTAKTGNLEYREPSG
jgi:hypothetical protein